MHIWENWLRCVLFELTTTIDGIKATKHINDHTKYKISLENTKLFQHTTDTHTHTYTHKHMHTKQHRESEREGDKERICAVPNTTFVWQI